MNYAYDKPLVIDNCVIHLLWKEDLVPVWREFRSDVKHAICSVVYWEYMRQFWPGRYYPSRNRFLQWLTAGAQILPFGKKEAELATEIYLGLQQKWGRSDRRKEQLRRIQADIMIASVAMAQGLTVLTANVRDFLDIKDVIQHQNIGPITGLAVIDEKDLHA